MDLNKLKIPDRIKQILKEFAHRFKSEIDENARIYLFGSYAKGTAKKDSDLDIAIIVEDNTTKKEVIPYIETVKRREIIDIDYHIFTQKEFIDMLKAEQENVGKEIYRGNLVYYGFNFYCYMIWRLKNEKFI